MTEYELIRNFGVNLEREREKRGFSQQEMASKLMMSLSTYRRLISGETTKIEFSVIDRIHKVLGIYIIELMDETSDDVRVLDKFRSLSEYQKIFVNAVIEFENQFRIENDDYEDFVTVFIPTGDMEDGMIYDSASFEKLNVSKYRNRYGNRIHYAMKVTSNHLHPTYNRGDYLLITKEPIRDGDIGLFLNKEDGKAYIRKFHQENPCRLEPINDYGIEFFVNPDNKDDMDKWQKFGRIITKVR